MEEVLTRFLCGIIGAFLGLLIAVSSMYYFSEIYWVYVGICSAVCFVLAAFGGETTIRWLREVLSDV